eukprot:5209249-Pleurochrysis_carterae.AAC.3
MRACRCACACARCCVRVPRMLISFVLRVLRRARARESGRAYALCSLRASCASLRASCASRARDACAQPSGGVRAAPRLRPSSRCRLRTRRPTRRRDRRCGTTRKFTAVTGKARSGAATPSVRWSDGRSRARKWACSLSPRVWSWKENLCLSVLRARARSLTLSHTHALTHTHARAHTNTRTLSLSCSTRAPEGTLGSPRRVAARARAAHAARARHRAAPLGRRTACRHQPERMPRRLTCRTQAVRMLMP